MGRERRGNLIAVGLVILALLGAALFAARPTPVLGTDAMSLTQSINGVYSFQRDCRQQVEAWICRVWSDGSSYAANYEVNVDGWGCWTARRIGPPQGRTRLPPEFDGCVTLFSHLGL